MAQAVQFPKHAHVRTVVAQQLQIAVILKGPQVTRPWIAAPLDHIRIRSWIEIPKRQDWFSVAEVIRQICGAQPRERWRERQRLVLVESRAFAPALRSYAATPHRLAHRRTQFHFTAKRTLYL